MPSISVAVAESPVFQKRLEQLGLDPDPKGKEYIDLLSAQAAVVKDAVLKRDGYELGIHGNGQMALSRKYEEYSGQGKFPRTEDDIAASRHPEAARAVMADIKGLVPLADKIKPVRAVGEAVVAHI